MLKLFHKVFEFYIKRDELSKFQISFYDLNQSILNITKYCDKDIVSAKQINVKRVSSLAYLLIFSVVRNLQEGCIEL